MMDLATLNHVNEIVAYRNEYGEHICWDCTPVKDVDPALEPVARGNLPVDVSTYCEDCDKPIRETLHSLAVRLLTEAMIALGDGPDSERDAILRAEIASALNNRDWS